MKEDRVDAGKGLMHTDGYTMTEIVVLKKVVLMTIKIKGLLYCDSYSYARYVDG